MNFTYVVRSKEKREKFIDNILAFMQKYKLDGVELDWEYNIPTSSSAKVQVCTLRSTRIKSTKHDKNLEGPRELCCSNSEFEQKVQHAIYSHRFIGRCRAKSRRFYIFGHKRVKNSDRQFGFFDRQNIRLLWQLELFNRLMPKPNRYFSRSKRIF